MWWLSTIFVCNLTLLTRTHNSYNHTIRHSILIRCYWLFERDTRGGLWYITNQPWFWSCGPDGDHVTMWWLQTWGFNVNESTNLVGGSNPSEKFESVSWDDDIPNIWKNKIHVPDHQSDGGKWGCNQPVAGFFCDPLTLVLTKEPQIYDDIWVCGDAHKMAILRRKPHWWI